MELNTTNLIIILIVTLGIIFLIFLVIRSIVLWYYKIDHRIKQNDELIKLLREIKDKIPNKNDSFDEFLLHSPKKDEPKPTDTQKNYFKIGDSNEKLIKGFRYLISSEDYNSVHSLLLLNSDQIIFNYKQGQFREYEGNVSMIMFYINSSSEKHIFNGKYTDKNSTLSGEVTLNQNFSAENPTLLKFRSCQLEIKEWDDDYEISFSGTMDNDEKIEGNFSGRIEKLPALVEW